MHSLTSVPDEVMLEASSTAEQTSWSERVRRIDRRTGKCTFYCGAPSCSNKTTSANDLRVCDALAAYQSNTSDGTWVITSPNVDFIPEPVHGLVKVVRQSDGHFGIHDPICWPQILVDDRWYRWCMAIPPQPMGYEHPPQPIWTPLLQDDIAWDSSTMWGRGGWRVSEEWLRRLEPLVTKQSERVEVFLDDFPDDEEPLKALGNAMTRAICELREYGTVRSLVAISARAQRCWLLIDAWLEFHVHLFHIHRFDDPEIRERPRIRNDLMGAYTQDVEVAEKLFYVGVPVWLMRRPDEFTSDHVVADILRRPTPFSLLRSSCDRGAKFDTRMIYYGEAGKSHLRMIVKFTWSRTDIQSVHLGQIVRRGKKQIKTHDRKFSD